MSVEGQLLVNGCSRIPPSQSGGQINAIPINYVVRHFNPGVFRINYNGLHLARLKEKVNLR